MVGFNSDLLHVEGFGAVNIRNRYRHKLKFHIHLYFFSYVKNYADHRGAIFN